MMRDLKSIISESLLDDDDDIMDRAYDAVSNPFKYLVRVDDSVYDNPKEFGEVLKTVEELVAANSRKYTAYTNDKYKIAFNVGNGVTPRMYVEYNGNTYMIRGEKLLRSIRPAVLKLTRQQGAQQFRTYPPYYIPNKKLVAWIDEFFKTYDDGCRSSEIWNKYRGK